METTNNTEITVETTVKAPVAKTWKFWNEPDHIKNWCFASDDWHAPHAENELEVGKSFTTTMAAKDGSMSFDFGGVYTSVVPDKEIAYTMEDGRKVKITFAELDGETKVIETFDAENTHPVEMQRSGWQAILDNFKNYAETNQ